ncbi:MAG: hypothetical protein ACRC0J_03910, partial [Shewanella oncorhynchi]
QFGLNEEQSSSLSGALSPEELQYRAQSYQQRNQDKQQLRDAGWKGMAAEGLAYMVDPTMLPAYLIKTPMVVGKALQMAGVRVAQTATMGVVDRAIGAAVIGSTIATGQEATLSSFDTTRDVNDIILAGISGAIGGAAFSSLADGGAAILRKVGAKREVGLAMQDAVDSFDYTNHVAMINDADKMLTGAAMGRLENQAYGKYFDNLADSIPDPLARKRALTEGEALNKLVDDLSPVAAQRLDRGSRLELQASIKEADYALNRLLGAQEEIRATPVSGSGKALSQARQARSSELADLQNQVDTQRAQLEQMRSTLEPHASGEYAEAVADISRLQNGIIPDRLKQRYLDLIKDQDAAPPYDHVRSQMPQAEEPKVLPEVAAERAQIEADKMDKPADTSVGAKEVEDAIIFRDTEGDIISDTHSASLDAMRKIGERIPVTRTAGSTALYTRVMSKMKDQPLRGLASLVFNDPHGIKGGPQSAVAFADAQRTRIMPKAVFIEDMAISEHMRAMGVNPLQLGKYNKELTEFNRSIASKINELTDFRPLAGDDPVTRAAKARAQAYNDSLALMKRYGVRGFEDVDARANYQPVVFGKADMQSALDKFGEDSVMEVLTRGYMGGKIPLSSKSAQIVAENTLERFYRKSGSVEAVKPSTSISGRIAEVVNELKANNVPDKEIQTVINMLQDKALDASVSSRAMQSLHPDINATAIDGLRFVDIMDTSLASVDKYVREAAAQAAFAKNGLKSRRQVEDTITEAFKRHRKELSDMTERYNREVEALSKIDKSRLLPEQYEPAEQFVRDYERMGDMQKYRKFLDRFEKDYYNGIKATFGEVIEEANSLNTALGITGKAVNLMMLGFSGLAQVADIGVVIGRAGLGAVLRNVPHSVSNGVRSLLPSAGHFMKSRDFNNLAEVMGTISHQDYLFGHKMLNGAEYGDAVIGHVSVGDKALDRVGWLQSTMSFLRPMQGFIDELSARSMVTNLVSLSKDGLFTGRVRKNFTEIGKISDSSLDASLAHIRQSMDSGSDIFEAIRTMRPDLRDELGTAIRTVHISNISRSYYGELPAFTNTSMGKVFMKLQSFALVAYEKAIQRGFRQDIAGLVAATTWSAGIVSVFIDVDVAAQSLKQPESKRADFVRRRTEEERAYTIAGRMSQVAMLSTAAQFANLINPYQDSALKPFGEYRGVAAQGAIGKITQAGKSAVALSTDQSTDPEADEYKVYGAIPLLNTAMGMAILNTL